MSFANEIANQQAARQAPGSALQSMTSLARSTPAEDVLDALRRLNRALEAASANGWAVDLKIDSAAPSFHVSDRTHSAVRAKITKEV